MNHPIFLRQVAEFHSVMRYRQPEPQAPDLSDGSTNELRPALIKEELLELKDAKARVDELDALCDLQYVISGAALAWGYRGMFEGMQHMVTLRKIRDMDAHLAAMLGLNENMRIAAKLGYESQVFTFLCYIQERLAQAVWHFGFSPVFEAAFAEVHRSNMSKLWTYEELDCAPPTAFIEQTGAKYIVRRHDQKILKSPNYSMADLGMFV